MIYGGKGYGLFILWKRFRGCKDKILPGLWEKIDMSGDSFEVSRKEIKDKNDNLETFQNNLNLPGEDVQSEGNIDTNNRRKLAVSLVIILAFVLLGGGVALGKTFFYVKPSEETSIVQKEQIEIESVENEKDVVEDTSSNEVVSEVKEFSEEELLSKIKDSVQGNLVGEPLVCDFDGDGRKEMVCRAEQMLDQSLQPTDIEENISEVEQYFIYTNGENVQNFGNWITSFIYDTQEFLIPCDEKTHFAYSTSSRNNIAGGILTKGEIYRVEEGVVYKCYDGDSTELSNPSEKTIHMISHSVPISDETLDETDLVWMDDRYSNVEFSRGISDNYINASIPPHRSPKEVWGDTTVNEYVDSNGVHMNFPSDICVYRKDKVGSETITSFYQDRCSYETFLCDSTIISQFTYENSDSGVIESYYLGQKGDNVYLLEPGYSDWFDMEEAVSSITKNFYESYWDQFTESAWVE